MTLNGYYFGMISEVFPPGSSSVSNVVNTYQYVYKVLVTGDSYATIPTYCLRKDEYGSRDAFDDVILAEGTKVMVQFPRGDPSMGIIVHATRAYVAPQNPALGVYWMNRFNKIVRYIDKDGNYSVTSDSGPFLKVNTDKIILDDSTGESITIDKAAQTITIAAKTWAVNITGDATVTVGGKMTASVTGDLTATCDKLNVTAKGIAEVKADEVHIQGSAGEVLTNMTDPVVDSIFGEPTMGVPKFKAGG